jgi:hypothetical protein
MRAAEASLNPDAMAPVGCAVVVTVPGGGTGTTGAYTTIFVAAAVGGN